LLKRKCFMTVSFRLKMKKKLIHTKVGKDFISRYKPKVYLSFVLTWNKNYCFINDYRNKYQIRQNCFFFNLILVPAIGGRPKTEIPSCRDDWGERSCQSAEVICCKCCTLIWFWMFVSKKERSFPNWKLYSGHINRFATVWSRARLLLL